MGGCCGGERLGDRKAPGSLGSVCGYWKEQLLKMSLEPRDPTFTGSDVHHPTPFCRVLLAHLIPNGTHPLLLSTYCVLGQTVQFSARNTIFVLCVVPCTFHSVLPVCISHVPKVLVRGGV